MLLRFCNINATLPNLYCLTAVKLNIIYILDHNYFGVHENTTNQRDDQERRTSDSEHFDPTVFVDEPNQYRRQHYTDDGDAEKRTSETYRMTFILHAESKYVLPLRPHELGHTTPGPSTQDTSFPALVTRIVFFDFIRRSHCIKYLKATATALFTHPIFPHNNVNILLHYLPSTNVPSKIGYAE